jgi:hypothetical protein
LIFENAEVGFDGGFMPLPVDFGAPIGVAAGFCSIACAPGFAVAGLTMAFGAATGLVGGFIIGALGLGGKGILTAAGFTSAGTCLAGSMTFGGMGLTTPLTSFRFSVSGLRGAGGLGRKIAIKLLLQKFVARKCAIFQPLTTPF